MLSYKRIFWALRKIRLPVQGSGIVLDIGSGNNPHPRSDVLLDRLNGSEHRGGTPMLIDRHAIIGDALKLPFKDKSFDFVIASHVLEHIPTPEKFLAEIQRVGKSGYIETPNFLCERLLPSKSHCLEISVVDNVLHINKKKNYIHDSYIAELNYLKSNKDWGNIYYENPNLFHSRYYWKDEIKYKVFNPECSCNWIDDVYASSSGTKEVVQRLSRSIGWRDAGLTFYKFFQKIKRKERMKNFNLNSILICPDCRGELAMSLKSLHCSICDIYFSRQPYIDFENPLGK